MQRCLHTPKYWAGEGCPPTWAPRTGSMSTGDGAAVKTLLGTSPIKLEAKKGWGLLFPGVPQPGAGNLSNPAPRPLYQPPSGYLSPLRCHRRKLSLVARSPRTATTASFSSFSVEMQCCLGLWGNPFLPEALAPNQSCTNLIQALQILQPSLQRPGR